MKHLFTLLLLSLSLSLSAQSHLHCSFCKAIKQGNFNKVERIFKHQVSRHKKGNLINNTYYVHDNQINALVLWLRSHPEVEEACQEMCTQHIAIYPGWIYIGASFKTSDSLTEKSFLIQLGKINPIRSRLRSIPICFFKHLKSESDILVYKKMLTTNGFCEQQRKNCKLMIQQDSDDRIEFLKVLSLSTDTCIVKMKVIDNIGSEYIGSYGVTSYRFIAVSENNRPDKGINKGDTLALSMNLSKENAEWLANWKDPRPPMGWELVNPGQSYQFIINHTIQPEIIPRKKIRNFWLYGGANCVTLLPTEAQSED